MPKEIQIPKFWVTCYKCKTKFGISPWVVLKYVGRALDEIEQELKLQELKLKVKKKQAEKREKEEPKTES